VAGGLRPFQFFHPSALEPGLEVIVEILLPEQVQTVAAYTAQESIEHAGSEHAMQRIKQRKQDG
jgi:hypothetical protein